MPFEMIPRPRTTWQLESSRAAAKKTAAEAIDNYIAWRGPSRNDLRYLKRLQSWFGHWRLKDIGQAEMDAAGLHLYPNCTPATRGRQVFVPMSAVMNYAGVPVRFRKPPQPRERNRYLARDVAEVLIRSARDPDLKALITFLFFSGARVSEAIGLTPDRVDLRNQRVRLRLGKKGVDVWRPLHPRAAEALAQLPERRSRVFRWRTTHGPKASLRELRNETGVYFTFHMARHSFATWLADEGVNLKDIMEAGGWSSPKSVMRYIGSNEDRLRRAINRL